MIATSPPPASWTRPVVLLWSSCVVVTGALWLASPPAPPVDEDVAVVVDVPADGEAERDFAAAKDANVFGAARTFRGHP